MSRLPEVVKACVWGRPVRSSAGLDKMVREEARRVKKDHFMKNSMHLWKELGCYSGSKEDPV